MNNELLAKLVPPPPAHANSSSSMGADWELMVMPEVERLPAILRGPAEVIVYLKLTEDFVRTWTAGGNAVTPAMPHFQIGASMNFPTLEVIKWLARYHGWGGQMRDPATRPRKVTTVNRTAR